MKVSISHTEIKRHDILYFSHCKVEFSEEEKAIIRERSLFDDELFFKTGYVDYPVEANSGADEGFLQLASRLLAILGVIFIPFAAAKDSTLFSLLVAVCFVASFAIFIHRKQLGLDRARGDKDSIKIREVMKRDFSVCAFNHPMNVAAVDQEIRDQLESFKHILTQSAQIPTAQQFEL